MNKELDDKLVKDFPLLYRDRNKPMSETAMCWGFECDGGWFDIIYTLSNKLEKLIQSNPKYKNCRAAQVKEKFGTLSFYLDGYPIDDSRKIIDNLVGKAYKKSAVTCELCGKPGILCCTNKNRGRLKTVCTKCRKVKGNRDYRPFNKKSGIKLPYITFKP